MAKINVTLNNATFYDVNVFDIVKGEKFTLSLLETQGGSEWFSNNDPVLDIDKNGEEAEIIAKSVGSSKIMIFDAEGVKIKELNIRVVDAIVPQAVALGLAAETPELK